MKLKKTLTNILIGASLALGNLESKAGIIIKTFNQMYGLPYEVAQKGQGIGYTISNDISLVNYDPTNVNANITWNETYNYYGGSTYTINLPQETPLIPGTNNIPIVFIWQCNEGGARVGGDVTAIYRNDSIPEPTTLLGLGVLALSIKRRKNGK
jgi:hypothetical protein